MLRAVQELVTGGGREAAKLFLKRWGGGGGSGRDCSVGVVVISFGGWHGL